MYCMKNINIGSGAINSKGRSYYTVCSNIKLSRTADFINFVHSLVMQLNLQCPENWFLKDWLLVFLVLSR